MMAFSIVKKIGEGKYLAEDFFIIERVRKKRALNMRRINIDNRYTSRIISKNDRFGTS